MTQRIPTPRSRLVQDSPARPTRRRVLRAAVTTSVGARTLLAAGQAATQASEWPCLAVWHQGGHRPEPNSGLRIALWPDGVILFSPWPERLGEHMLTGVVEKADVEEMLKAVRLSGFFEADRDYIVPDSSFTTIAVRDGDRSSVHSFHEYLLPGFGGDINTDATYRRFVRTWKRAGGAIEALAPTRVERLAERKEFRGYVVEKWYETPWRDGRKWKGRSDK